MKIARRENDPASIRLEKAAGTRPAAEAHLLQAPRRGLAIRRQLQREHLIGVLPLGVRLKDDPLHVGREVRLAGFCQAHLFKSELPHVGEDSPLNIRPLAFRRGIRDEDVNRRVAAGGNEYHRDQAGQGLKKLHDFLTPPPPTLLEVYGTTQAV